MVYNIYEFKGNITRQSCRDFLFQSAMKSYLAEQGVDKEIDIGSMICRTEKGKPYIQYAGVKFNISHSDDYWVCIIGQGECGVDVQKIKTVNYGKLASRFFSENEEAYVSTNGSRGFFKLWARREAFAKYTGEGFFSKMPDFVGDDGELLQEVAIADGGSADCFTAYLRELEISEDTVCVYCTGGKDDEIRVFAKR